MSPWISHCFLRGQSDERLLGAAARGNGRAFEMLVERHRASLMAHAQGMLGPSRAEDALQQGLLQAWVALQRGVTVRNPRPWLFRVVHNSAVDALRSARPEQAPLSDSVRAPARVEADVERLQAVRETLAGVAALPDLQREALLRTALDGHSHEHVGSALGVSADAVRGLVYRARTSLRAAASALVPPPLIGLLAAAHRRYASLRPVGSGGGGSSQVLLERGAAIISAGALAAGVVAVRGPIAHHAHQPRAGAAAIGHAVGRSRTAAGVPGAGTVEDGQTGPPGSSTDAVLHEGSGNRSRTGTPHGRSGEDSSGDPGSTGTGPAPEGGAEEQRQERGSLGQDGGGSSGAGAETRGGAGSEAGRSRSGEDGGGPQNLSGGGAQDGSGGGSGSNDGSDGGGPGSEDGGSGSHDGSGAGTGTSSELAFRSSSAGASDDPAAGSDTTGGG